MRKITMKTHLLTTAFHHVAFLAFSTFACQLLIAQETGEVCAWKR